ncbi:MAG: transcriptional regulator [Promethearchaeota archaeon]|nr:MAG: transcriptional regulator [Candidatus Lokiarchaeota archaeon]
MKYMNQRTSFENIECSVAQTLNIIGEWWTPLILKDIFFGIKRFNTIQSHLDISRKVLSNRLDTLMKNNIIYKKIYQKVPPLYEYELTQAGEELFPLIISLMKWGDKWVFDNKDIPIHLLNRKTLKEISPVLIDANTKKEIVFGNVVTANKGEWDAMIQVLQKKA